MFNFNYLVKKIKEENKKKKKDLLNIIKTALTFNCCKVQFVVV